MLRVIGRRAVPALQAGARSFSDVAPAKHIRLGEKAGVGLRYRMPKVSGKAGLMKLDTITEEQLAENLTYWKGACPAIKEYDDVELMAYRKLFQQHASMDKITLTAFQRFVKQKCKSVGIAPEIMPTLSVELWSFFDEDTGNFIDFGEFVSHYPHMVKSLVRYMVRDQGPTAFFDKFAVDGILTAKSIETIVETYGLDPFTAKDISNFLNLIAPNNPKAASAADVEMWASDYTSLTAPSINQSY